MNPNGALAVGAAAVTKKYVVDTNFFGRAIWTFSVHFIPELIRRLCISAGISSTAANPEPDFSSRLLVNGLLR